ncbi:MAG: cytochrome P450 [Pseudomonadota bacterium]
MELYKTSPEIDNAIVRADCWADEQGIHEQLAWLRKHDPLRKITPDNFEPFWNVTKYEDIKAIEGNRKVFLNDPRPVLSEKGRDAMVQAITGRKHLIRSLISMDDPDHRKYRTLTQGWFMGANLRKLQARVDELAKMYVDRLADMGGECDFVKDVAIWYPLRVIMEILGVPEEDEALMLKLTRELFGPADPDNARSFAPEEFFSVVEDFESYFAKITASRRAEPTEDVASLIANAQFDGEHMPEVDANGYYIIIATAGHDTTSACTAGGVLALMQHPDQLQKFLGDMDAYMPTLIDEVIRWVTPVRHFMRTANEDFEIRGKTIKTGESAILWYPSANRDEDVYTDPFEFRIDRKEAKQLSFGFGAHVCLGQHLARMEISALYRELFSRVKDLELTGEPRYIHSSFVGGLKSLPIRYKMK